jgi:hypothetical protein
VKLGVPEYLSDDTRNGLSCLHRIVVPVLYRLENRRKDVLRCVPLARDFLTEILRVHGAVPFRDAKRLNLGSITLGQFRSFPVGSGDKGRGRIPTRNARAVGQARRPALWSASTYFPLFPAFLSTGSAEGRGLGPSGVPSPPSPHVNAAPGFTEAEEGRAAVLSDPIRGAIMDSPGGALYYGVLYGQSGEVYALTAIKIWVGHSRVSHTAR